ncbi:hypothetical protein V6615_06685 [Oscillospiraceae bacterium PP1C4]
MLTRLEYKVLKVCNALLPHEESRVSESRLNQESPCKPEDTLEAIESLAKKEYISVMYLSQEYYVTLCEKGRALRKEYWKMKTVGLFKLVIRLVTFGVFLQEMIKLFRS